VCSTCTSARGRPSRRTSGGGDRGRHQETARRGSEGEWCARRFKAEVRRCASRRRSSSRIVRAPGASRTSCRRCVSVDTSSPHLGTDMPQVLGELTARHTDLSAPERKHTGIKGVYHAPTAVLTGAQDRHSCISSISVGRALTGVCTSHIDVECSEQVAPRDGGLARDRSCA
jgi:hypothetical protein